jgi:protein phosphatase
MLPAGVRKRLGLKSHGSGGADEDKYGKLSAQKSRRFLGRGKRQPLREQAQFSQIHLINTITNARSIAHIGQKIDRSWTEMYVAIDADNAIRLSYTIVDRAVYGSNIAVSYEQGTVEVTVDNTPLTPDISLPVYDASTITIAGIPYTLDMFRYESLPIKTRVDAAWVTNIGPVRDDNQDAIGIYQHPDAYMFVIADGVGGGYAGDVASEYAVKYMLKTFQKNIAYSLSWVDTLSKAFEYANAEIRRFAFRSPYPVGTTLTTLVIREWTAYIAHVGDTRIYLLRGTQIKQITTDHKEIHPVERTTKYEHIPDELLPTRDVLVRAIGKRDTIDPEIMTMAIQPGDKLLMLTDGVTSQVSNDEIYQMLITKDIDDVPDALIQLANKRDNTDNISVILIDVLHKAFEKDIWRAVDSDRVFIGGKHWKLDLSRPLNMNTQYPASSQFGCLSMLIILLACALLWWGMPRLTQAITNINNTNEAATVETVAPSPTQTVQSDDTTTPIAATNTITPEPTTTESPLPTASFTPTLDISPTPLPIQQVTVGPTATQIPPTSTLRA